MSWKVRRASAKCFAAFVATSTTVNGDLGKVGSLLIQRTREREESVLIEVLHALRSLIKRLGASGQEGSLKCLDDEALVTATLRLLKSPKTKVVQATILNLVAICEADATFLAKSLGRIIQPIRCVTVCP